MLINERIFIWQTVGVCKELLLRYFIVSLKFGSEKVINQKIKGLLLVFPVVLGPQSSKRLGV